eukprot:7082113-Pyramimonas_sp.AAC.1
MRKDWHSIGQALNIASSVFVKDRKCLAWRLERQIRVLLVCTTVGQHLAQELGQYATCKPGKAPHVTKALLSVASTPLITYWKRACEDTPRCLPIDQKVFILCNDDNHDEYVNWAQCRERSEGGFPVQNIISNGTSGSQRNGIASDIACFVE